MYVAALEDMEDVLVCCLSFDSFNAEFEGNMLPFYLFETSIESA